MIEIGILITVLLGGFAFVDIGGFSAGAGDENDDTAPAHPDDEVAPIEEGLGDSGLLADLLAVPRETTDGTE